MIIRQITPSLLSDACDILATALGVAYPDNMWMVLVDPESGSERHYHEFGFIISTLPTPEQFTRLGSSDTLVNGSEALMLARPWVKANEVDDFNPIELGEALVLAFSKLKTV